MTFKIKDGLKVGSTDVFNTSGTLLVNAPTATKWETARTLTLGGNLTGNVTFDGSENITLNATVTGVELGTDTTGNYVASIEAGTPTTQTGSSGLSIATNSGTTTIAHADTSSVSNLSSDNSDGTVIQDLSLTFDTFGHVTAVSVGTTNLDSRYVNTSGDTLTGFLTLHANPSDPMHAANKAYVDEVAQGLKARTAANALSASNLSANYNNGTSGVGATLTATTNGTFPQIDGVTLDTVNARRLLVIGQTNKAHNGLYVLIDAGSESTPWVLRRCSECDTSEEIPGSFVFVGDGNTYENTGWVATVANLATFQIGVDDITWIQFSGAGSYQSGDGLTLTGNIFAVGAGNGITVGADTVSLASTVAGNGLTFDTGVINVVGTTDRISVTADAVDIASTYVGQTSITTLGTVSSGTWQGSVISPTYGGTGVNNGTRTLTIGTGNVTLTAQSGGSTVTLPASGTVATLAGVETLTNKTLTTPIIGTVFGSSTASGSLSLSSTSNATKGTITIGDNNAGTLTMQAATANLLLGTASSSGFLKVAATTGLLSIDTTTYLTSQSSDFSSIQVTDTDTGFTWAETGTTTASVVGDTLKIVSGTNIDVDVDTTNKAIRISTTLQNSDTTYTISTEPGDDAYSEKIRLTAGGSGSGTDDVIIAVGQTDSVYGLAINETGDTITISHANTSPLTGVQGSAGIASITVDGMGHVTAVATATYLTAETDTLATVTGRGNTTTTNLQINSGSSLVLASSTASVSERKAITTIVAGANATSIHTVDSWAKATYRMAKYLITVTQGSFYQTSEITVFNDGTTNGQMTEYSVFSTDATQEIGFTIDASGSNVVLRGIGKTGVAVEITYKIDRTLIVV